MHDARRWSLPAVIGATGIVYGDIGTSPLYAFETALNATGTFDALAVLGVLSLIFWSLMLSVTFKYVTIMMRADNQGEGGILALFALAQRAPEATRGWFKWLIGLALAGTAFFFCDALITPAISVLSAVEGLELLDPDFRDGGHSGHAGRAGAVVLHSKARHRPGRPAVRAGHDPVVRGDRGDRCQGDHAATRRC